MIGTILGDGYPTSLVTPVGHKANVLVFGPGGYKFVDFTRVGILLTVFLFIVSMIFLPFSGRFNTMDYSIDTETHQLD